MPQKSIEYFSRVDGESSTILVDYYCKTTRIQTNMWSKRSYIFANALTFSVLFKV